MKETIITIDGPSVDDLDHVMAKILADVSRRMNADFREYSTGPGDDPCEAESPELVPDRLPDDDP